MASATRTVLVYLLVIAVACVVLAFVVVVYLRVTRTAEFTLDGKTEAQWLHDLSREASRGPTIAALIERTRSDTRSACFFALRVFAEVRPSSLSKTDRARVCRAIRDLIVAKDGHPTLQIVALRTLIHFEDDRAVPDLIRVIEDPRAADAVCFAVDELGRMGKSALPALSTLETLATHERFNRLFPSTKMQSSIRARMRRTIRSIRVAAESD